MHTSDPNQTRWEGELMPPKYNMIFVAEKI